MTQPTQPNLTAGVLGALVGAVAGAAAWAVLTSVTGYKIGYAAIGVGALCGFLAGRMGGGAEPLPPIAAVVGLFGCVLGDVLTDAHEVAAAVSERGGSLSMWTVLKEMVSNPGTIGWDIYKAGFGFIDVVFYGFAAAAAFQLATKHGMLHTQHTAPVYDPPTGPTSTPQAPAADFSAGAFQPSPTEPPPAADDKPAS